MLKKNGLALLVLTSVLHGQTPQERQNVRDHYLATSELLPSLECSILRMQFDVTGDEKAEIFLSNSQMTGNGGGPWVVYSPLADGTYRVLDEIGFHGRFFRFDRDKALFVTGGHVSVASTALTSYRVDENGFTPLEGGGICPGVSPDCHEELERIRAWQKNDAPPLFFLDLSELQAPPPRRWHQKLSSEPDSLVPLDELVLSDDEPPNKK
jgi:hypothetical protein